MKPVTAEPSAWTTPTDSCPRVRSLGTGSAPLTVCTSEVQISAAVVLTIASSGPGVGIGFSTTSVRPISLITNARMVSDTMGSFADGCVIRSWPAAPAAVPTRSDGLGDIRRDERRV